VFPALSFSERTTAVVPCRSRTSHEVVILDRTQHSLPAAWREVYRPLTSLHMKSATETVRLGVCASPRVQDIHRDASNRPPMCSLYLQAFVAICA